MSRLRKPNAVHIESQNDYKQNYKTLFKMLIIICLKSIHKKYPHTVFFVNISVLE